MPIEEFVPCMGDAGWRAQAERYLEQVSLVNQAAARSFVSEEAASGIRGGGRMQRALLLRDLDQYLGGRAYGTIARADASAFLEWLENPRPRRLDSGPTRDPGGRLSYVTMTGRIFILRRFLHWLHPDGSGASLTSWIRPRKGPLDKVPTDRLLTMDEQARLFRAATPGFRQVAVAVLIESGMRVGELCSLRWRHLEFDPDPARGCVLTLPLRQNKTGSRRIRLFESTPWLRRWRSATPLSGPDDALFLTLGWGRPRPLTEATMQHTVRSLGRRAGLGKRTHPHLLRHCAATLRARLHWREAEMRAFFGWSRKSSTPEIYVHLAGQDYEAMEFQRRGVPSAGPPPSLDFLAARCPPCGAYNLPGDAECYACGGATAAPAACPAPPPPPAEGAAAAVSPPQRVPAPAPMPGGA